LRSPSFFFTHHLAHRPLHSFPTRRSSDLERTFRISGRFVMADTNQPVPVSAFGYGLLDPSGRLLGDYYGGTANARGEFQATGLRSEEHTSELQSRGHLVCRLLLEKKKKQV